MSIKEIRSGIFDIVNSIQNEEVLQRLYDHLKSTDLNKTGDLWNSLTSEQKKEVLLAYEESKDKNNIIDRDDVFKRTDEDNIYKTSSK